MHEKHVGPGSSALELRGFGRPFVSVRTRVVYTNPFRDTDSLVCSCLLLSPPLSGLFLSCLLRSYFRLSSPLLSCILLPCLLLSPLGLSYLWCCQPSLIRMVPLLLAVRFEALWGQLASCSLAFVSQVPLLIAFCFVGQSWAV